MGVAGISLDDFCRLRLEEIDEILRATGEARTRDTRTRWEVMRTQAFMTLSPFCKNLPEPRKLLPFPWDMEADEPEEPEVELTHEERMANEKRLRAKLGW